MTPGAAAGVVRPGARFKLAASGAKGARDSPTPTPGCANAESGRLQVRLCWRRTELPAPQCGRAGGGRAASMSRSSITGGESESGRSPGWRRQAPARHCVTGSSHKGVAPRCPITRISGAEDARLLPASSCRSPSGSEIRELRRSRVPGESESKTRLAPEGSSSNSPGAGAFESADHPASHLPARHRPVTRRRRPAAPAAPTRSHHRGIQGIRARTVGSHHGFLEQLVSARLPHPGRAGRARGKRGAASSGPVAPLSGAGRFRAQMSASDHWSDHWRREGAFDLASRRPPGRPPAPAKSFHVASASREPHAEGLPHFPRHRPKPGAGRCESGTCGAEACDAGQPPRPLARCDADESSDEAASSRTHGNSVVGRVCRNRQQRLAPQDPKSSGPGAVACEAAQIPRHRARASSPVFRRHPTAPPDGPALQPLQPPSAHFKKSAPRPMGLVTYFLNDFIARSAVRMARQLHRCRQASGRRRAARRYISWGRRSEPASRVVGAGAGPCRPRSTECSGAVRWCPRSRSPLSAPQRRRSSFL